MSLNVSNGYQKKLWTKKFSNWKHKFHEPYDRLVVGELVVGDVVGLVVRLVEGTGCRRYCQTVTRNGECGNVNKTNNPGNDFTASARISDNTGGIGSFVPTDTLNNSTQCDERNEDSCDITHFERCSKDGLCKCLRGYLPNREDNKCVAAQFFRGEIPLDKNSLDKYGDKNTLNYEIRQVLFSGFSSQGLTGILDIDVISMSKKDGNVVFEIALNKDTAPRRQQLQTMYNRGLTASAYVDIDGMVKLSGTNLVLGQNVSMSQYLKLLSEFSHCVDPNYNYCDLNARCTHSMRTFTCQCEEGFDDFSPDIFKAPGENCKVSCKCENNGTCSEGDGVSACVCPEWYIGTNCEINGKGHKSI
ncbi:hypothetical protein LOTGIDRAFT_157487 [Lottia gigantea]|uniref:EGF-like domain-containing protein n=1 Tax=Lottia gigantea TaxID=225164 RepID=V4ABD2_LOTGI|nr:hypothetical protein LOTGIDRAFT_157487 [Lottia gigantea]ESP01309.1 hypothetical protein LOTGIDRAFT_157487 [Lottia gigantea]